MKRCVAIQHARYGDVRDILRLEQTKQGGVAEGIGKVLFHHGLARQRSKAFMAQ